MCLILFLDKFSKLCVYLSFHFSCFLYVSMLEITCAKRVKLPLIRHTQTCHPQKPSHFPPNPSSLCRSGNPSAPDDPDKTLETSEPRPTNPHAQPETEFVLELKHVLDLKPTRKHYNIETHQKTNSLYGKFVFLLDLFLDWFESKWLYEYKMK